MTINPDHRVLYEEAASLCSRGDYYEALKKLLDLDSQAPNHPQIIYAIAGVQLHLGRRDEVKRLVNRLTKEFHDSRGEELLLQLERARWRHIIDRVVEEASFSLFRWDMLEPDSADPQAPSYGGVEDALTCYFCRLHPATRKINIKSEKIPYGKLRLSAEHRRLLRWLFGRMFPRRSTLFGYPVGIVGLPICHRCKDRRQFLVTIWILLVMCTVVPTLFGAYWYVYSSEYEQQASSLMPGARGIFKPSADLIIVPFGLAFIVWALMSLLALGIASIINRLYGATPLTLEEVGRRNYFN